MNPEVRKRLAIAIIILISVSIIVLVISSNKTSSITKYLSDGGSVTYKFEGLSARLSVALTSTDDYMHVKIVVDGQSVYDENNIYSVNFGYNVGFGYHIIHIIIENPTVFGLGASIQISGVVSVTLW